VLPVAWEAVRRQPGRFAALASAVALAILLVVVTTGIYFGLLDALIAYPRTLPGEVVVAEAGGSALFMRSASRLRHDAVAAVRALPGVAAVDALYGRLAWIEVGGRRALVYVVGLFPEDTVGGPPRIVAGRARPELAEIVVDRVLAHDLGLRLRDHVRVGGARLRVAGIAEGANAVIGTFAFVHRNALGLAGVFEPSHLLVTVAPGVPPADVARRIRRLPGLEAYLRETFLDETVSLARDGYRPILGVVAGVAAGVAGTLLAIALWAFTIERREEYGVLKAIGLPARRLYAIAVWQALFATAGGVVVGLAAGYGAAGLFAVALPRFVMTVPWWVAALVGGGAVVIGLAAAAAPVRVIGRIDPALVVRV
jgi:putative ABC transport system permease protein